MEPWGCVPVYVLLWERVWSGEDWDGQVPDEWWVKKLDKDFKTLTKQCILKNKI